MREGIREGGKSNGATNRKDLGKDAQRVFHDMKEPGAGDRTMDQLRADAQALYEEHGVPLPSWMQ